MDTHRPMGCSDYEQDATVFNYNPVASGLFDICFFKDVL